MFSKFLKLSICLICTLVLYSSCGNNKQDAPKVTADYPRTIREEIRVKECQELSIINNFLNRDNLNVLLKCTGWDKKFPSLFNLISEVEQESWDFLVRPLNKHIFENRERRERLISYIQELDKSGALDDLSKIITPGTSKAFINIFNKIFNCIDTEACNDENSFKTIDIKNMLKFLVADKDTYKQVLHLANKVIFFIKENEEMVIRVLSELVNNDQFKKLRLSLLDELALEISKSGFDQASYEIIENILTKTGKDKIWILEWFRNEKLTFNTFQKISRSPYTLFDNFYMDFAALGKLLPSGITCNPAKNNFAVTFNCQGNLKGMMNHLRQSSQLTFFDKILEETHLLQIANETCPQISNYETTVGKVTLRDLDIVKEQRYHSLNLLKFNYNFSSFMEEELVFNFTKRIVEISTNEISENVQDPLFLLSKLSTAPTDVLLQLFKNIDDTSANSLFLMYKTLNYITEKDLTAASGLIKYLYKSPEALNSSLIAWNRLGQEDKEFLLSFLDRFVTNDIMVTELLDFSSKVLNELTEVISVASKAYMNEVKVFERSVKDVISALDNEKVQSDLDKLISKDYIIKIIKILSRSIDTFNSGKEEVYEQSYVEELIRTKDNFYSLDISSEIRQKIDCITMIIEDDLTFHDFIRDLPLSCQNLDSELFFNELIIFMNEFTNEFNNFVYTDKVIKSVYSGDGHHVLDDHGIFSPSMINMNMSIAVILDEVVKNTRSGIQYIVDTIHEHLFKLERDPTVCENCTGYIHILDLGVSLLKNLMSVDMVNQQRLRNVFVRDLEKDLKDIGKIDELNLPGMLGEMLQEYSDFVPLNPKVEFREHSSKYDCKNYMQFNLDTNPCYTKEIVKKYIKSTLKLAIMKNDQVPTVSDILIQSIIPEEGVLIPYTQKRKDQKKYVITLKELLEFTYEATDKNFPALTKDGIPINQMPVIVLEKNKSRKENKVPKILNTGERVELVLRSVGFDMNYLGAHYMNSVAKALDYNFTVNNKYKLFKRCVFGLRFCGKFMNKHEFRMARNSVRAYPSLLDANTVFKRADLMQAMLRIIVASSSTKSQKSKIAKIGRRELPIIQTKKELEKHNGRILNYVGELSVFSHLGRVLRDRVGRTVGAERSDHEFYNFIDSKEMEVINKSFMRGFPLGKTQKKTKELLNILANEGTTEHNPVLDDLIDWIASLNYEEQRTVENFATNLLVIAGHLGDPQSVYYDYDSFGVEKQQLVKSLGERYQNNNLYKLFDVLDEVLNLWPKIKKVIPTSFNLVKFVSYINHGASFLKESLLNNRESAFKDKYYRLLNESFILFDKWVLKGHQINSTEKLYRGLDIVKNIIIKPKIIESLTNLGINLGEYISKIHFNKNNQKTGDSFDQLGNMILTISKDTRLDIDPLWSYLEYTTIPYICEKEIGVNNCYSNYHYDEIGSLISYFGTREDGTTKLVKIVEKFLLFRIKDIKSFIDEFMPLMNIEKIKQYKKSSELH
jgi:hypothetical protein